MTRDSDQPHQPGQGTQTRIEEPDHALKSYLDTLLSEIDEVSAKVEQKEVVKEPISHADTLIEARTKTARVDQPAPQQVTQWPSWAEQPFQVLLFKVNGITMGIPLNALRGILDCPGETNQLPGQPSWSMGVIVNRDNKVVVIDTAQLLMPERLSGEQRTKPQSLLLIGRGDRALAVDAVSHMVLLEKERVRWRHGDRTRPWYAGIMIEELSVLLDEEGVLSLLTRS
jgi:purine-binding chemotaxis protein CheW